MFPVFLVNRSQQNRNWFAQCPKEKKQLVQLVISWRSRNQFLFFLTSVHEKPCKETENFWHFPRHVSNLARSCDVTLSLPALSTWFEDYQNRKWGTVFLLDRSQKKQKLISRAPAADRLDKQLIFIWSLRKSVSVLLTSVQNKHWMPGMSSKFPQFGRF